MNKRARGQFCDGIGRSIYLVFQEGSTATIIHRKRSSKVFILKSFVNTADIECLLVMSAAAFALLLVFAVAVCAVSYMVYVQLYYCCCCCVLSSELCAGKNAVPAGSFRSVR